MTNIFEDPLADGSPITVKIGDTERVVTAKKIQMLLSLMQRDNRSHLAESSSEENPTQQPASSSLISNDSLTNLKGWTKAWVHSSHPSANAMSVMRYAKHPDLSCRLKKCSSLRGGKNSSHSPCKRKFVRFADVFGLDLTDVKTFFNEVPPRVPKSAFWDLTEAELSDLGSDSASERPSPQCASPTLPSSCSVYRCRLQSWTLAPLFDQPCASGNFMLFLQERKICLEMAYKSGLFHVKGVVRVLNMAFHKQVHVRFTTDDWQTVKESEASYLDGSCDGFSDKFKFCIDSPDAVSEIGRKLQFCLRFVCAGQCYWDNNLGKNYAFQCLGPPQSQAFYW